MNQAHRVKLHRQGVKLVTGQLKEHGLLAEPGLARVYDLLVSGFRIAVRISCPGKSQHVVTDRKTGKRYRYHYLTWGFNFHRHNRGDLEYCDVFVCVALRRHGSDSEIYVIPRSAVSGPTWSLHGKSSKPYRGRYAQYLEAWDALRIPDALSESA